MSRSSRECILLFYLHFYVTGEVFASWSPGYRHGRVDWFLRRNEATCDAFSPPSSKFSDHRMHRLISVSNALFEPQGQLESPVPSSSSRSSLSSSSSSSRRTSMNDVGHLGLGEFSVFQQQLDNLYEKSGKTRSQTSQDMGLEYGDALVARIAGRRARGEPFLLSTFSAAFVVFVRFIGLSFFHPFVANR